MTKQSPNIPPLPGWHLLGAFPDDAPDDVGSWLLHSGSEAMLLELPPGLTPYAVKLGLAAVGAELRYVTASHTHEDHLDPQTWNDLIDAFPDAEFICPSTVEGDRMIEIAGEPAWLVKAPKHSRDDVVTCFRGVAMTGDIETGMLGSVNREVRKSVRAASMDYLREFPLRTGYQVHTTISAHLNSVRTSVDWPQLFGYAGRESQ